MDISINTINSPYVSGLFSDKQSAERAYQYLLDKGYISEEINVAMASTTKDKLYSLPKESGNDKVEEPFNGSLEGSILGGLMGGIAFAIGALGSNLGIRGLNLVIMGPFASGLVGSSLGAIAGGLIGHILSPDSPDLQSELFAKGLKNGKILLAVTPHDLTDADQICVAWSGMNAEVTNTNRK